ncbi:hypothetical protein Sjap_020754 [Stephania japonica]|uniref:protein-serine/threonine phosphatase n=1 Tax=Stephania japonica TaxID=461633 RepID=A0AAP0I0P1_9MAGN
MAEIRQGTMSNQGSPAKCREARRRRIEMRRYFISTTDTAAASGDPSTDDNRNRKEKRSESPERPSTDGGKRNRLVETSASSSTCSGELPESSSAIRSVSVAVFGSISVSGRSREMEDAISEQPGLCRPAMTCRKPVHFFGVYDGHGGAHVAKLCKERMHVFLEEELMKEEPHELDESGGPAASSSSPCTHQQQQQESRQQSAGSGAVVDNDEEDEEERRKEKWRLAMERSFEKMDEVALTACACGSIEGRCGCDRAGFSSEIVGSTAVVAVLTPNRLLVANCGDSRAVLSRAGRAIPLSSDHKPDRPDELERIEAAGGRVIFLNGARVLGILAMSRALVKFSLRSLQSSRILVAIPNGILLNQANVTRRKDMSGDKYLKPIVISQPELSFSKRTPEDECLILASDGLWDVLSNDVACDVARRCLFEGSTSSAVGLNTLPSTESPEENLSEVQLSQSRCSLAAALLTRLALGRKSSDNISVIVIDLKRTA